MDYGGVFDLYYKLPALQSQGVLIHLHCFDYGRGHQPELNRYCESVHYYHRRKGLEGFSFSLPYIVSSRYNAELFDRLLLDDHPILMEGIHSTFLLTDKRFGGRRCFVRLHNVEHIYYKYLFDTSSRFLRRLYYAWESKRLLAYEKKISRAAEFWPLTDIDLEEYQKLGYKNIAIIPLFMPPWQVKSREGKGSFCLYHANLEVDENEKAAIWLLRNVFNDLEIPFVVAGKNPSHKLNAAALEQPHTCLVSNPTENEMQDMIQKAHIHVIPSFNATGIKLKLFNSLYNGRHCIVNEATVLGTSLSSQCHIASSALEFKQQVQEIYATEFTATDVDSRRNILDQLFDNAANARKMIQFIFG